MSLGENDSIHLMLPLFHTAAWNLFTLAILMMGGRVILTSEFHPGIALRILREEKPTCCMAIETIYKAIASHPDFEGTDFSGLRYIYSGAAPMSKSTMELYWAKGAPLTNGYGMTEAGPNNFMHPKNQLEIGWIRKKWNSIGKPIFFNEIKIVDQEGNPVPTGMAGELLMHSNLNFEGYWNQPEATAEILRDGWIHSGDIARMDEDGYCYICGRLKNMYISGGENIFPLEVEQLLGQHPAVADVCIYGVPDSYWGEVGKALIVRRPEMELTEEDLRQFIGKQVPKIRIPKYWMFVNQIPKTSVGKTDVEKAKQLYGDF